jgi:ABC-type polysaccharide/polyol phosphate export permease
MTNNAELASNEQVLDVTPVDEVTFPRISPLQKAWLDLKESSVNWRIWFMLSYQDIKLRYRRSVLGPFWITLSMAITLYSMGFLYAHLFRTNMRQYYPYLVAGMLGWSLISTVIMEVTETFTSYENLIKQTKLPYTLHIHRVVMRNLLIFFHNLIVMAPIYFIFHDDVSLNFPSLMLLPNLVIIYANAFFYGMALAMLGARYRDISQIIKSLVQVAFFVTPIMWNPAVLPEPMQVYMNLNPFYTFVDLILAPLIGQLNTSTNYAIAFGVTLFGFAICARLFTRFRSRIIYWL